MPDMKSVMSGLEGLTEYDWRMYHSDSEVRNIAKEALELLKEYTDGYINLLSDYENLAQEHEKLLDKKIPLITNGQEIIRCKDCKHGRQYETNAVACEYRELATEPEWFCADWKRKEGL